MATVDQSTALSPTDKPKFPCETCGAVYSRLEYLRRHERKHTEQRPFPCSDCSKTFARSDVLLRHRRRCHPEAVTKDATEAAAAHLGVKTPSTKSKNGKASSRAKSSRKASIATIESMDGSDDSPGRESLPTPHEPSISTPVDSNFPLPSSSASYKTNDQSSTDLLLQDSQNMMMGMQDANNGISISSPEMTLFPRPSSGGTPSPTSGLPPLYPSLMPLFTPLSNLIPLSSGSDSTPPQQHQAGVAKSSSPSPWLRFTQGLNPSPPLSNSPYTPFQSSTYVSDSNFNTTNFGGSFPVSINGSTSPLTDAELYAYLIGEATMGNELGLDIFQPERRMNLVESQALEPYSKLPYQSLDPSDRFYLPPGIFTGCYSIEHWALPPLFKLCRVASHTLDVLTSQMSIIHEPTFRLDQLHGFTAFSMCTTGTKDAHSERDSGVNNPCPPDPWKWVSAIIRQDKSDRLVKHFARRGKEMSFQESFSLIQALLVYHVPAFLSPDQSSRIAGLMFLNNIVQIARQVGLFKPDAEWLRPVYLDGFLDTTWKEWIQRETVRRTTWLVYVLDTIACIEAGLASHLTPRDLRSFPLPAPAPVWNARTAEEWREAMRIYRVDYPLEKLLQKTFDIRTPSPPTVEASYQFNADGTPNLDYVPPDIFHAMHEAWSKKPSTGVDCLGTRVALGPFARLCAVLTLLRGVLEFGEGKRKGGQVTQIWAVRPDALEQDPNLGLEANILASYKRAFDRWRVGWDIDHLCHNPYAAPVASLVNNPNIPTAQALPYCSQRDSTFMHDATPYYWFGTVLMDLLGTRLQESRTPRLGVFGDMEDAEMLNDRTDDGRINLLKGLDYRGMLDVAKQFAHQGEGI